MKSRFVPALVLFLLSGYPQQICVAQSSHSTARPLAAEFTLSDLGGNKISLSTYRGRVVLLNFWATWCAPCREETPELVGLQNRYRSQGLQIIGVSLDDESKAALAFYRQFKINYPVVLGDARLAERYGGVLGLPMTFLIGCDGRIDAKYSGKADIARIEKDFKTILKAQSCSEKNVRR
jgi:cytochrome c biogenesis protein CcmG, thiol:disulfide interchange protein DsbE